MPQLHAWCQVCQTVSVVEALKTLGRYVRNERLERGLAEVLAIRTKPQRCLICGNTNVDITNDDLMDLSHGMCVGTLRCTFNLFGGQMIHGSDPVVPHIYDAEGDLLSVGIGANQDPLPMAWPSDWATWQPMWWA